MALIVLVVVIPLIYFLYSRRKKENMIAKGCEKNQLLKANWIKYDQRQIKILRIMTVLFGILTVLSWIFMFADFDAFDKSADLIGVLDIVYVVIFCSSVISGPVFLCSLYQLLSGMSYMRRLQQHGYELPEDKRQYDYILEKLPKQQSTADVVTKVESRNKHSFMLGVLSLLLLIIFGVCNVLYLVEWSFYHEEIGFMICMIFVVDIVLLVYSVLFFRQTNEVRYKDDVEIDSNRKNRMPLVEGVLTIMILLCLSVFMKYEAYSLTDYIFKSHVSADQTTVQNIERAFESTYIVAEQLDENAMEYISKYNLQEGIDITTWNVPQDAFQSEVASVIGISDFSELRDEFHTVDGDAIVFVRFENGEFIVELQNQVEKAKNPDEWMIIE